MKNMIRHVTRWAAFAGAALLAGGTVAYAAEGREGPADRIERLEQRLNQLAEHQEQFMRRMGGQMEQLNRPSGGRPERMGTRVQSERENVRPPMVPPGARPPMLPGRAPGVVPHLKVVHDLVGVFVLIWIVCNILMAVWIFTDIRKRGEGSAIFVALALLVGLPAALIYAVTRIGDKKTPAPV